MICALTLLLLLQAWRYRVHGASSTSEGAGPHSKASNQWRIVNMVDVSYGWAVGELKMFSDTKCQIELTTPSDQEKSGDDEAITWKAIASGDNNAPAERAFDRLTWTEWRAQCYMCKPRAAWVGVQFSKPVNVLCMKLYQWGLRDYKADGVMLQRWEASRSVSATGSWQDVLRAEGMGGETWDTVGFTLCDHIPAPEHGRVALTNGGFYPSSAKFSCSGARIMVGADESSCAQDGTWSEDIPQCYPAIALVILISGIFTTQLIAFGTYFVMVVRHKPPPLRYETFIPDDSLGSFTSHEIWGVRDEEEDDGSAKKPKKVIRHVLLCLCCRLADTWYSVGQVPYFVGVWIPTVCCPFLPCIACLIRGQIRRRFVIKGSITRDCFLWVCCLPCVATQEAKHVDHMCDIAEEEAEVMRRNKERTEEKERKIREQIEMKQKDGAVDIAGKKIGKDKDGHAEDEKQEQKKKTAHLHPTFIQAQSVMDMLERV